MYIPALKRRAQFSSRLLLLAAMWCMPLVAGAAPGAEPSNDADQGWRGAVHRTVVGIASVYARHFEGRKTASGEPHNGDDLVAAHRSLPLGSEVRVTNLANQRSVVVRINDRGPMVRGRIIDLSRRAAAQIGLRARGKGITRVRLEVLREGEPGMLSARAESRDSVRAQRSRT